MGVTITQDGLVRVVANYQTDPTVNHCSTENVYEAVNTVWVNLRASRRLAATAQRGLNGCKYSIAPVANQGAWPQKQDFAPLSKLVGCFLNPTLPV